MLPKSTSQKPEPPPTPRWQKLLYAVGVFLLSAALVAAAWGLLWYWPQQAGEDLGVKPGSQDIEVLEKVQQLEKDRVATGAQVFLGLGILVGIYFTWRRIRATERQAQTAQDQMELARRQQTAERFTQAIEHLGHEKLDIRLGGIYALEKIARDEPEEYFNLFREVLSAFVRESAQTSRGTAEDGEFISPPTDLQGALTVLGRYPPPNEVDDATRIHWSGAHLEGADLNGANLEGALLDRAHLEHAYLRAAYLKEAVLLHAHLEGADFCHAHLEGAFLIESKLKGAKLICARLENACLIEAHVEHADLRDAHLEGANLAEAHLEYADFRRAHLECADLRDAHLEGANLFEAHFENTRLSRARYNHHTKFPNDFTPTEEMIYVEESLGDEP